MKSDVIVIGGGAAGMMAAYAAADRGAKVTLLEKNDKLGKKIYITGKGRCNITNANELDIFFENIVRNPKFLMSALHSFSNQDLIFLLHSFGLQTKIERGQRVFPRSDKSSDVIATLDRMLREKKVQVQLETSVKSIKKENEMFHIATTEGVLQATAVILSTGGASYPGTGSTGDGYKWAADLGHSIVQPRPALIPLVEDGSFCKRVQGLALKNICFSLFQNNKEIYSELGELLFTHFGLSGPLALSASSFIDYDKGTDCLHGEIDLKPALDRKKLDARLLRDFDKQSNKQLINYMSSLMPHSLIEPFLFHAQLDGTTVVHQITRDMRQRILEKLKCIKINISGTRSLREAIITAGGVDVQQVDSSTMESKVVADLFFAGEILDVSALTGGYNLQVAFSTGFLAGSSI